MVEMTSAALEATIDLAAIAHNVAVVADRSQSAVMAVVKADGYGHGAVPVAQAALSAGATDLGVATIAEALALRSAGIAAPVVAWLHTPTTDFGPAIETSVEIAVSSPRQLARVVASASAIGRPALVSAKIDTGLARNGVGPEEWPDLRDALAKAVADESIVFRAAMCHLARGDEPDHPLNDVQAARLDACVQELDELGIAPHLVHISNSAAALARPDLSRDLVRAGIAIYGRSPLPRDHGLIPAMTLSAEVSMVKKVSAGQGVSYGHTWTAPHDTTLALLPAGYADGVPRLLSNLLHVQINGRSYPGVGRVCMDQMVVDLGTDSDVAEGDRAVLFGTGSQGGPTAKDWADAVGTIDYEIVSGVRGRVERRYVGASTGERL